jgi:hypothetical protein
MSLQDTLRKAAGLLVELPEEERPVTSAPSGASGESDDDLDKRLASLDKQIEQLEGRSTSAPASPPPAKTVEQIVRDAPGPNLDQVQVPASAPPPTITTDGKIDFSAIYQQANLPASPFTCEQMLEIMASLPAELPLETKRQTVKVTLSAMGKSLGATPETIVADTSRKLAALANYAENVNKKAAEYVTKSQLEIASMEKQIEDRRKAIEAAQAKQAELTKLCEAESDRLDDVLEFFSLDVPPSKHAENG